jgi:phosphoribosylformylglycinamidine synthase
MEFLHDGDPPMLLTASWQRPVFSAPTDRPGDCGRTLVDMIGRLNLASNEGKARHYDHEVKGLTVVKPWIGVGADVPAEATVFLAHHGSLRGYVLSEGINPFLSDLDTFAMAATAVDEAVRRQLCAGARLDRIAALDNFCWPDPVQSTQTPDGEYKLAQLVRACRGLYSTCRAYGVPLISGKDSMKNEAVMGGVKISVPPTLLVSAIGQIDDVRRAITADFKSAGDALFVLGETAAETGGSEYFRYLGERQGLEAEGGGPTPYVGNSVPTVDADRNLGLYRAFSKALETGIVRSAATPAKGGLAAALARAALAGGLGAEVDIDQVPAEPGLATDDLLFAESNGRFVVTVASGAAERFEKLLDGQPCRRVGTISEHGRLVMRRRETTVVDVELAELEASFKRTLAHA